MNYFAQELKKICDRSGYIQSPKYVGRTAVFKLADDITGKMEFVTQGYADHYTAFKLSLFNRREGIIDSQTVRISEIIGKKTMNGQSIEPHIWTYSGESEWYGFKPTSTDYSAMAETTDDYLSCFADQEMSESEDEALGIDLK